jgi:predicted PurR-regulated permease PerM
VATRDDNVPETAGTTWPGWLRFATSDEALRLALLGIAAVLVWRLADVLLLLFFAILIATVLRGCADALAAWLGASPRVMFAVVTISIIALLATAVYWIGPALAAQASDLVTRLSSELNALRSQYGHTPIGHAVSSEIANPQGIESGMMGHVSTVATSTLGVIGELFVVVVISLYLAIAPALYMNGVVSLVPIPHRPLIRRVLDEIGHDLRFWFLGQLVDMITVGILSAIGFYFLGVPVPFALATIAGLFTIVPYFGVIAAAIPAVMVALTKSWMTAVWVIVILAVCHVAEGYLVAPLVQRRMVHLPPALLIFSMAIAGALFGALGIILGTPLAVATMVAVKRLYVEEVLGDHSTA